MATAKGLESADSDSPFATRIVHDSTKSAPLKLRVSPKASQRPNAEPSISEEPSSTTDASVGNKLSAIGDANKIQVNEITSSDNECDSPAPPPIPSRPAGGHRPSVSAAVAKLEPAKQERREPATLRKNMSSLNAKLISSPAGKGSCYSRVVCKASLNRPNEKNLDYADMMLNMNVQ